LRIQPHARPRWCLTGVELAEVIADSRWYLPPPLEIPLRREASVLHASRLSNGNWRPPGMAR